MHRVLRVVESSLCESRLRLPICPKEYTRLNGAAEHGQKSYRCPPSRQHWLPSQASHRVRVGYALSPAEGPDHLEILQAGIQRRVHRTPPHPPSRRMQLHFFQIARGLTGIGPDPDTPREDDHAVDESVKDQVLTGGGLQDPERGLVRISSECKWGEMESKEGRV